MKWKNFYKGFKEGRDYFSSLTSAIVNSVLLSVVYFIGIGFTSIFAKIFGKNFLDLKHKNDMNSYWEELNLEKKENAYYFKQF